MSQPQVCIQCREKRRRCDGSNPCSNCVRYSKTCNYLAANDKRRRKYHTEYIVHLERRIQSAEALITELVKGDPELEELMAGKLNMLQDFEDKPPETASDISDFSDGSYDSFDKNEISQFLETSQIPDPHDAPFELYLSELQMVLNTIPPKTITNTSNPIAMVGHTIMFTDCGYSNKLLDLFEEHFAPNSFCFKILLPAIRSWKFETISEPSKKLLLSCIYGIASKYSSHFLSQIHESLFISQARDAVMNVTCRTKIDMHTVLSLYLLSCYEMGEGDLSQSYIFDAMACSLLQHIGFHVSYEHDENQDFAPRNSPLRSSVLWTVCSHDRIVTSLIRVPCVIHYKRIISPLYKVESSNDDNIHIAEMFFAYNTRLFYIFDRFSDQIDSINFDVGDSTNQQRLAEIASKTLQEFEFCIPKDLKMSSLNWEKCNDNQNLFILLINFNFIIAFVRLNKKLIKRVSSHVPTLDFCLRAANIVKIITQHMDKLSISKFPVYFMYGLNTMVQILLSIPDRKPKKVEKLLRNIDLIEIYRDCTDLLKEISVFWKSSTKYLQILEEMSLLQSVSPIPLAENFDFNQIPKTKRQPIKRDGHNEDNAAIEELERIVATINDTNK